MLIMNIEHDPPRFRGTASAGRYWLDVPSTCRDYRIMACGFSGVELLLIGAQVMLRHDVMRELKCETASLPAWFPASCLS